ncbi:MAG: ASKHA domain-containing protein [Candidatus Omnitrophica bacterium]|jgi:uncharacterized 2Fe-2S/4Fe-4S cluster protein (DUF4445 family)|nr:ASKHA domain-containing protein [Candidatus Omnitrophota bacterium]
MDKCKVTFYPEGKTVEVPKGTTVLSAAISCANYIKSACAGEGTCGQCKVIIKDKGISVSKLACLTIVKEDMQVEIPEQSRLIFEKTDAQEIELSKISLGNTGFEQLPLVKKIFLKLPAPKPNDPLSDWERITREIDKYNLGSITIGITTLRQIAEILRDSNWQITITLAYRETIFEVIHIEPGDTTSKNYGFCFDIGTTTITGELVDLNNRKSLGASACYNKQASFGSDVITRIIFAKNSEGLEKLHSIVTGQINDIIRELIQQHQVDLNNVYFIICAGNTTMTHILLKTDPSFIRRDPYTPVANSFPSIHAVEAGIIINPRGVLMPIPAVASYVGGDITSGILACSLDQQEHLSLLIDIGTNGEIVLGNKEFLISCAASAGPAFEGSGVSCGMRASRGAIQKVSIDNRSLDTSFQIIGGDVPALGICGSGYISLIAQMLEKGIIDKAGNIQIKNPSKIKDTDLGRAFIVCHQGQSNAAEEIIITESDIENIKRAKAAIYSAAETLIKHMGFSFKDVHKFFIAGGFGTYLDIQDSIAIGLLPDLEKGKFLFVGNSSIRGAREIIFSIPAKAKSLEIANKTTYIDLSNQPGYMEEYMAALFFPHTDLEKFKMRNSK